MTAKLASICWSAVVALGAVLSAPGFRAQQDLTPRVDPFAAPSAAQSEPADAIPNAWYGPGPLHKVWLDASSDGLLATYAAQGALLRDYDYGAFHVAIVDERALGGHARLQASGAPFADEQDLMVFNELVLHGRMPEATLAALAPDLRYSIPNAAALDPSAGLYVVQFEGPIRDEWVAQLDALGTTFRQYLPLNAYVVQLPPARVPDLDALAQAHSAVQYVGLYEPAFRLHATLRSALQQLDATPRLVTLQLVDAPGVALVVEQIRYAADLFVDARVVGPYVNVQARLHPVYWQSFASSPFVFQIEPQYERVRMDERQGQIVAGNTTATGPSAPGYLAWLASAGFNATQFGSFAVNVADDALGLTGHPDLATSRVAFTLNPTGQTGAQGGHGFLNAHIVAGFNDGTGTAVEDSGAYNYGLGIAPWARVGSTAIFGAGGISATTYESQAYGLGSRISSNSWGYQTQFGGPVPDYDAASQEFDFIARDAQSGTAGNQGYTVVFSAGNNGSGANTVSTPGTAKNILTVAAGENDRQTGSDGCGITNTGANNWNDIATFSSRGPVNSSGGDGRWKPEICAPGTHIEAGIPQSNYDGSSVCNAYWPTGQTLYGWSSGTSHSCPAVAGGAALVYQWFLNQSLSPPSPAMVKAMLVGGAEYMSGTGANDTLPSNSQGTGKMHLPRSVGSAARVLDDQTAVLGASGQTATYNGNVVDTAQPFRVALVWTDAPGPTSGAPYVNNLNLSVSVGGSTYLGNVCSGRNSIPGGTADIRNNTEVVLLPAGTSGAFTVTVTAAAIAGDGVPGNADTTDQDFAIVIYNGSSGAPAAPVANFSGTPTAGFAPLAVNFSDASTGSITGWAWTFGDGGTSSAQSPSHTYTTAGTYSVDLLVTGPGGSHNLTRTNYIVVSAPPAAPVAAFSGAPTSGTAPHAVNFSDASTGSITSWAWTFGDGGTSSAQTPSHTYTTAGTYNVGLTVTGPGGSNNNTKTGYITVSPGASGPSYYLSFAANTAVPGLGTVADEDIVKYDSSTGAWSMYFDGSDVGLGSTDVDAFQVRANGSILLNFDSATFAVAGLTGGPSGTTVTENDVILFTPTSTGSTTAGSYSFYFDGSDVGLTTSGEDIDGICEYSDGSLGVSTGGSLSVTGLTGLADEDVIRFTGTFGSATAGTWSYFFDGSDVGYSASASGDTDAIWYDGAGNLYLSTLGAFSASGASWGPEDVVRFNGTYGTVTSGTSTLSLDLSTLGIAAGADVDGLTIRP
jgi:PKD repeat protein